MKTLTVFTPTFNRAHLLPRLYESLCNQTSTDFLWMVIDDGSSDITSELIKKWQTEEKIEIQYFYKENGGMHTAHNLAYSKINTELNVCIDSDDWMPEDAVEKILNDLLHLQDKNIAGIIGLDSYAGGAVVGHKFPEHITRGNLDLLKLKFNIGGDKKFVLKTSVVKTFPNYPEYAGEKLVPLGILYHMIGRQYDFILSNEIFCIVEYQSEGSTHTIFKQYRQSPKGFAYVRIMQIRYSYSLSDKIRNFGHLISSAVFADDYFLPFQAGNKILAIISFPLGILLNIYIRIKTFKIKWK